MDNGGAIYPNVIEALPGSLLKFSGTAWDAKYREYCRLHNLEPHPARMRIDLAAFFIQFLTEPRDLVLDPFAGSNSTGAAAEALGRNWLSVEANSGYAEGSKGRFQEFQFRSSPKKTPQGRPQTK